MNFNMSEVSTTKMTSKGQVVIPEEIREYMGLESGVKFLVMASDDSIIFKKINPIPEQDIKALLNESQKVAKEYGITEEDLDEAIAASRKAQKSKRKGINPFTGASQPFKAKPSVHRKTTGKQASSENSKNKDKGSK